jgi:hypothetical protein
MYIDPVLWHIDPILVYIGKGKAVLIALPFGDHDARRGWMVSITLNRFTPGSNPVPIVQKARWALVTVWICAKNLAPTGIRSAYRPDRSQSLYQLSYPAQKVACVVEVIPSNANRHTSYDHHHHHWDIWWMQENLLLATKIILETSVHMAQYK